MGVGMRSAGEVRIYRSEAVAAVLVQAALNAVAVHEQMQVGDGFAQGHHHLARVQFAGEQHGQQVPGGGRLHAVLLDGQHAVLMMGR